MQIEPTSTYEVAPSLRGEAIPAVEEPTPSATPKPKVVAAALAGSATTIVLFLLSTYAHVDLPGEVAAAITTVLSFLIGYITSEH